MYTTAVNRIFEENNLRKTKFRKALLSCLVNSRHALSHVDFKEKMGKGIDKSTLYRNLSAFEDAGIIHKINDHSGVAKYAFGKVNEDEGRHAHFVCEKCETVFCVENMVNVPVDVPPGFKTKSIQTIITGICGDC
ncbi:MAG: Fur family transcriptional regulator [Croceivirga sp.]